MSLQTLGIDDISRMDSNNRYYRYRSRLAQMKQRAEKLGSKVEYLIIQPELWGKIKNEKDRLIAVREQDGRIKLTFLTENKDYILHVLYPDKHQDKNNISGYPKAKVITKRKKSVFIDEKSMSYRTIVIDKTENPGKKKFFTSNQPEPINTQVNKSKETVQTLNYKPKPIR